MAPNAWPATANRDFLKAISLEQKAKSERVIATITRSTDSDYWIMERTHGRAHVLRQNAVIKTELYLLDKTSYWRANGGAWIQQAVTHPLTVPLNPTVLFTDQLTGVQSGSDTTIGGKLARNYTGSISWMSGGRSCSGTVSLAVTVATGLPTLMRVKGSCESLAVSISEAFEYGVSIIIDAPSNKK
ncbi:MAG: hypothetical protein ABJC66_14670 [Gammaproteobacteria bacterium]